MRHCLWRGIGVVAAGILLGSIAFAGDRVEYLRDIKPIFKSRCSACHGALKQESELRLDTGSLIRQGGLSGKAVTVGKPGESLLIERISAKDPAERMPAEGEALTAEQIDKIRQWILEGAISPKDESPEQNPREHWAFRRPVRVKAPAGKKGEVIANPIDGFLSQPHRRQGLPPQPFAPKPLLLRRVYLDLIGLPPTPEELLHFWRMIPRMLTNGW